jgi:hypothetical protein
MADEPQQEQQPEPSQEELLRELEAEFRQLKVSDVLVQTVFTVSSLGYRSLGDEDRDLDQAKLAIDALRALVPAMKDGIPSDFARDLDQMVANMQLAYAKAAADGPGEDAGNRGEPSP